MREILTELIVLFITAVVLPLILRGCKYLFEWLRTKIDNAKYLKYVDQLEDAIESGVRRIFQTYVDRLKKNDEFTDQHQKEALRRALDTIKDALPDSVIRTAELLHPNLDEWLITKVEATIDRLKNSN